MLLRTMSVTVIVMICFVSFTNGLAVNLRTKRNQQERFVEYLNAVGQTVAYQTVTFKKRDVRLDVQGGISAVLDFDKMLLTLKSSGQSAVCLVAPLQADKNSGPISLEKIRHELERSSQFVVPQDRITLKFQRSSDQSRPELSSLSEEMCQDSDVVVMEPKRETPMQQYTLNRRPKIRPKRMIGSGIRPKRMAGWKLRPKQKADSEIRPKRTAGWKLRPKQKADSEIRPKRTAGRKLRPKREAVTKIIPNWQNNRKIRPKRHFQLEFRNIRRTDSDFTGRILRHTRPKRETREVRPKRDVVWGEVFAITVLILIIM